MVIIPHPKKLSNGFSRRSRRSHIDLPMERRSHKRPPNFLLKIENSRRIVTRRCLILSCPISRRLQHQPLRSLPLQNAKEPSEIPLPPGKRQFQKIHRVQIILKTMIIFWINARWYFGYHQRRIITLPITNQIDQSYLWIIHLPKDLLSKKYYTSHSGSMKEILEERTKLCLTLALSSNRKQAEIDRGIIAGKFGMLFKDAPSVL